MPPREQPQSALSGISRRGAPGRALLRAATGNLTAGRRSASPETVHNGSSSPAQSFSKQGQEASGNKDIGRVLQGAKTRFTEHLVGSFVNKLRKSRDTLEGRDYVPDAASKVRKTWYTRRDADGRTVIVQVEEGVENSDLCQELEPSRGNSICERITHSFKGGAAAPAPAADAFAAMLDDPKHDPFHHVLHEHSYIHPHSAFMRTWESFILMPVSAYFVMMVPVRLAFPRVWPTPGLVVFDALASMLLLLDTLVRFFVAFEDDLLWDPEAEARARGQGAIYTSTSENAHLVVDRVKIRQKHLRFRFWVGLFASLPVDLLVFAMSNDGWAHGGALVGSTDYLTHVNTTTSGSLPMPPALLALPTSAAYAGLLRLSCGIHMVLYFTTRELSATIAHTVVDRLLKNLLVGLTGAHMLACGWTFIARQNENDGYRSHLSESKELAFYAANGDGEGLQYLRSIFWALVTMSGVGYGDITPISVSETIFAGFAVAFGTSFFLFTVGSVTSLIASADAVNAQVRARLSALKTWMGRASLPPEMRLRILENFYEQHVTRKGAEDRLMISELPKFLQHEVAMYLNKEIVSSTPLFRGCSATLVASMVEHLHAHRCLPLDGVVHKGDVGEELYLVKQGLFEVLNEDDTVHRMLGSGSYFGEIALLCHVHRTMSVRAVSHALVFVIERAVFAPLMQEYPGDFNQLLLSAALRYRTKAKNGFVVGDTKESNRLVKGRSREKSMDLAQVAMSAMEKVKQILPSSEDVNQLFMREHRGPHPVLAGVARRGSLKSEMPAFHQGVAADVFGKEGSDKRRNSLKRQPSCTLLRRISSVGRAQESDDSDRELASCSNPLAFIANAKVANPSELVKNRKLKEISLTPAERYSQLRDAEIVQKLMSAVQMSPSRVSISVPDENDADADQADDVPFFPRKSSYTRKKSTYEANQETLLNQLREESCKSLDLGEGSAYVPRYTTTPGAQGCPSAACPSAAPEAASDSSCGTGRGNRILGWLDA